jgi:hypothetical protein
MAFSGHRRSLPKDLPKAALNILLMAVPFPSQQFPRFQKISKPEIHMVAFSNLVIVLVVPSLQLLVDFLSVRVSTVPPGSRIERTYMQTGYDQGCMLVTLGTSQFVNAFPESEHKLWRVLFTAVLQLGALLGGFGTG